MNQIRVPPPPISVNRTRRRVWWRTGQVCGRSAKALAERHAISCTEQEATTEARFAFLSECEARHLSFGVAIDDARWVAFRDGYLSGWEML